MILNELIYSKHKEFILDNSRVPKQIQKIMERVRFGADFMPKSQLIATMESEYGSEWHSKFQEFEYQPRAAASVGQVHRAKIFDGTSVAVKVQYPGIAESIDSDLNTLSTLLVLSKLLPKGLYLERTIEVARKELSWEVDYCREAESTEDFGRLLMGSHEFLVPRVYRELSTSKVLVLEWMEGFPLDRCATLPSYIRDKVKGFNTLRKTLEFDRGTFTFLV